jgi:4-hydroxybenzoate polyprenyltransferase
MRDTASTSSEPVKNSDSLVVKALSLFSTVRLYNVVLIALAQLLAAAFIIAPDLSIKEVVLDYKLWFLIVASALSVAGGYIINNFYDREKDLINRPQKTLLENHVSRKTLWSVYFLVNGLAVILGYIVSFKAGIFYALYIFLMWLYSHKLKRTLFVGNFVASLLAVTPFFVLFMYYKNFYPVILVHGTFLFLIITMRELIKDLENLRGDLAHNYRTIPVVLGEKKTKQFYTLLTFFTIVPISILILYYEIGKMDYYFTFIAGGLMVCLPMIWNSTRKKEYLLVHFILKVIIAGGVFSILLIDLPAIWNRIENFLL